MYAQVNITRPYLCANHLAAPYTGAAASAAEAPSVAPAPQSAAGAIGEGYGGDGMQLLHTLKLHDPCIMLLMQHKVQSA